MNFYIEKKVGFILGKINIIENHKFAFIDVLLSIAIFFSVAGFLSIRGMTNKCFFVLLAISVFFLRKSIVYLKDNIDRALFRELLMVIIILSLPTIAVFVNHVVVGNWAYRYFDGPTRMLYSVFIMMLFIYKRVNYSKMLFITIPLAIFLTALEVYLHPEFSKQWGGRFATYYVDPNTFGTYSVVLFGICLFQTQFSNKKLMLFYQIAGVIVSAWLVMGSGTRGSWVALPFILIVWLFVYKKRYSNDFGYWAACLLFVLLVGLFYFIPSLRERALSGVMEVYYWVNGESIDTSSGIRLSMWKMSWQLFIHNPVFGYGDGGYIPYLSKPWFGSTATDLVKETIACCGPHNELLTNMLNSGILGGISVIGLFFVPLFFFLKNTFNSNNKISEASQVGLVYIIVLIVSSITGGVFHLKYTATFYGLTIAGLFAQIFSEKMANSKTQHN